MSKDIKNLKEAVGLAVGILKTVKDAKADGSINAADLGLLIQLVPLVGPAVDGIGEVPSELADLSAAEAAELSAFIMAAHAVDGPKAQALIEGGFKVLAGAVQILGAFRTPA